MDFYKQISGIDLTNIKVFSRQDAINEILKNHEFFANIEIVDDYCEGIEKSGYNFLDGITEEISINALPPGLQLNYQVYDLNGNVDEPSKLEVAVESFPGLCYHNNVPAYIVLSEPIGEDLVLAKK